MMTTPTIFPDKVDIEGIDVDCFSDTQSLFERLAHEVTTPEQSVFAAINVHIANTAHKNPSLKQVLKSSAVVYCDGAGIVLASKVLHSKPITQRLTAADWLFELWAFMANRNITGYYIGGEPGIIETALNIYQEKYSHHKDNPNLPIVGYHHGYILDSPQLEHAVIENINQLKPDILFVGMGCPFQELWIEQQRNKLNVSVLYPIGATLDYLTAKVPRCPQWMGNLGLEWLFRLSVEPKRLFKRYVYGNPYFLSRILAKQFTLKKHLTQIMPESNFNSP